MVEIIDPKGKEQRARDSFQSPRMRASTILLLGAVTVSGWAAFGVHSARAAGDQAQVGALHLQVAQLATASANDATAAAENQVLRVKLAKAEAERDAWRKSAGKAYTAFLRGQDTEGGGVMRLPLGATFDCVADSTGAKRCDPSIVYPPKDF